VAQKLEHCIAGCRAVLEQGKKTTTPEEWVKRLPYVLDFMKKHYKSQGLEFKEEDYEGLL